MVEETVNEQLDYMPKLETSGEKGKLALRLRRVVKQAGGPKAVAAKSGIVVRTLHNYLSGRSDIGALDLAAVARVTNVPLSWLVAGEGAVPESDESGDRPLATPEPESRTQVLMRRFTGGIRHLPPYQSLDLDVLTDVAERVERAAKNNSNVTARDRALAISMLYQARMAGASDSDIDRIFSSLAKRA